MASSPDPKGRFTPKKSKEEAARDAAAKASGDAAKVKQPAYQASGRYTAPTKAEPETGVEATKPWVPYAMFGFLAVGLLMIILNYAGFLPGAPSNWYLLGGLAFITGGFFTATQLK